MNAPHVELAFEAHRASQDAARARDELSRLRFLSEELNEHLHACIEDCKQPRYVLLIRTQCTKDKNFRCGCARCNEWRTWTEWFNRKGYYTIMFRQWALDEQIEAAERAWRAAVEKARRLNNMARQAALACMEDQS